MLVYDVHTFYYFSIYWSDTSLCFGLFVRIRLETKVKANKNLAVKH